MAIGWNLWVWLVSVVVRRYIIDILIIIITFPYILHLYYLALFWQHHPYFFVNFKMFFRSCLCYFCAML